MNKRTGFAVWITGLPASGKSSVTRELAALIKEQGLPIVVLESDVMRGILAPEAGYSTIGRDRFYEALRALGTHLTQSGVNVIFDATANKRRYRDAARAAIEHFLEAYVDCPLEVCAARDPKGIYKQAASGSASRVPGIQAGYEPPLRPETVIPCGSSPEEGAAGIFTKLKSLHYL